MNDHISRFMQVLFEYLEDNEDVKEKDNNLHSSAIVIYRFAGVREHHPRCRIAFDTNSYYD